MFADFICIEFVNAYTLVLFYTFDYEVIKNHFCIFAEVVLLFDILYTIYLNTYGSYSIYESLNPRK